MRLNADPYAVPASYLREILAKKPRPQKVRNLELINEVCREQAERRGEISVAVVGRLCEDAGGISVKALYNRASSDYQGLIKVWEESVAKSRSGDPAIQNGTANDDWVGVVLRAVTDPAARALIQSTIVERNRLRNELNVLRAAMTIYIDRRPVSQDAAPSNDIVLLPALDLTPTEIQALTRAIEPSLLRDEGWQEGSAGEILNARGRRLFEVGFASAVRKALACARGGATRVPNASPAGPVE